jgi:hypothetical protein
VELCRSETSPNNQNRNLTFPEGTNEKGPSYPLRFGVLYPFSNRWITSASSDTKYSVTFTKDIAPIFYKNCIGCHRSGEIAPMSLMTYKEVRPWAKAIREKVANRAMPPWHPDPKYGQWSNDLRLSQKDVDTVVAWVDGGAAEGNAKDLPPTPKLTTGWQIGEPDVVFQMPVEFTVPAEGAVPYQHFIVQTNFKEDRYVQALEARAGNLSVVHHIVMYVRDPAEQARGRGQNRKFNIADGILGALSPGQTPFIAKPGEAKTDKSRFTTSLPDALHAKRN